MANERREKLEKRLEKALEGEPLSEVVDVLYRLYNCNVEKLYRMAKKLKDENIKLKEKGKIGHREEKKAYLIGRNIEFGKLIKERVLENYNAEGKRKQDAARDLGITKSTLSTIFGGKGTSRKFLKNCVGLGLINNKEYDHWKNYLEK